MSERKFLAEQQTNKHTHVQKKKKHTQTHRHRLTQTNRQTKEGDMFKNVLKLFLQ